MVGYDGFTTYNSIGDRPTLLNDIGWHNVKGILVNYIDYTSLNIKSYLDDLDLASSTVKAHLTVSNEANKAEFVTFNVTDISNINNTYAEIVVNSINSSKSNLAGIKPFNNGTTIAFEFTRTGEKGQKGAQGYTGFPGIPRRFQGITGFQGYQGHTVSWWNAYTTEYNSLQTTPPTLKALEEDQLMNHIILVRVISLILI